MISITSFSNLPEISSIAISKKINVEFNGLVKLNSYSSELIENTKNRADFSLISSAHGPFFDLIVATDDKELKELILSKFIRAINACKELKIRNLIFHTGWFPKTYSNIDWINNSILFWNEILEYTDDNINIFIENVYENNPELINTLINEINRINFKACLDIGHVNISSKLHLKKWIEILNCNIGHVHFHNNHGNDDEHNGLKNGNINIDEVISVLKANSPNANWNLEIKNGFEESIEILENRI